MRDEEKAWNLSLIQKACDSFGWMVAMDTKSKEITGLIIGEPEYIKRILEGDFVTAGSPVSPDEILPEGSM